MGAGIVVSEGSWGLGFGTPSPGSQCCRLCSISSVEGSWIDIASESRQSRYKNYVPVNYHLHWGSRLPPTESALNLIDINFAELNEELANSSSGRFPTSITQYSCPGGPRYPDLQFHAPPFPAEIMPVAYVVDHLAQQTRVLRDITSSCTQLPEPAARTSSGSRTLVGL